MNVAEQKSHDTSHGWKPINTAPKDKFVLLACPSGYTTTPWVFTTGILHSDYKVGRWVDHANDDLSDWGMSPIFWRDDIVTPDSATPAPAPAQEVTLTDGEPAHGAGLLEQRRELDAIEFFESTNRDSYEFKKSVRGIYANPAVARDWKWFQLGMKHATEDES